MSLSRRHLFGLFAGATAAPMLAPFVGPAPVEWDHYTERLYGMGYVVTREELEDNLYEVVARGFGLAALKQEGAPIAYGDSDYRGEADD